jgi:hypothetical protein
MANGYPPILDDQQQFDPTASYIPKPMAPPAMPAGASAPPMADAGAAPAPDANTLPTDTRQSPQAPPAQPGMMPLDQTGLAHHAMQQEGQARHAAKMKDFGDAEAHITAGYMKSPDEFAQPTDYSRYLENLTKAKGALRSAKAEYELSHPWGSMESSHPGLFGKVGHAFGEIGNVAGQALAPGLAEAIPSSREHLLGQEALGEQELSGAIKEESESAAAGLKGAQAGTEATKPALNVAKTGELGAKEAKEEAQTNAIELAGGKKVEKMSDGSLVEVTPNPDGSSGTKMIYKGDPKRKTSFQKLQIGGKTHDVLVDANTGDQLHDLGEAPPPGGAGADKGATMISPEGQVIRATPGMQLEPGTQTPSGFAEGGRPTQMMRNTAQRATQAVQGIPSVRAELSTLRDQLGPVSGRWNEFMQGKVGMENPQFAGLRADLLMLSSAVALAHAQGRLPENLRAEFDAAINAPKQNADNLISILDHIQPWLERASAAGEGPGAVKPKATAPEAPATGGGFAAWKAKK